MLIIDPITNDITISRGSKEAVRFTITDALTVLPKDVSGWTWKLTVKADIDDPISSAIFQLTSPLANGIDVALAASAKIDAHFATAHTAALAGDYVYDLEGAEPGEDPQKAFFPPLFRVRKDVSTPGAAPAIPGIVVDFGIGIVAEAIYLRDPNTGLFIKVRNDGGFPDWGPSNAGPPPY